MLYKERWREQGFLSQSLPNSGNLKDKGKLSFDMPVERQAAIASRFSKEKFK